MMRRAAYEAKRGNKKKVLVVESCVGGHAIWLYVTCPDSALEDESEMERLAILAAQAYRNRWQVERPRKPPEKEPDQLEFAFPDAA